MRFLPKYCFVLIALLVIMTIFLQMAEPQRNPGRQAGRRRSGNRRRNNRRGRGHRRQRGGSTEGCEEIHLPMCKGFLSYTHTRLPNKYNHTTQLEVYREIEHLWSYMDHYCSANTRTFICAEYLPKCKGPNREPEGPCKRTCMTARRKCSNVFMDMFNWNWDERFPCEDLPRRNCVRPTQERRCTRDHPVCINNNRLPVCNGLSFSHGTLPNLFYQCQEQVINKEIEYYSALRQTNCHDSLDFLLCGIYAPFCIRAEIPFAFPCQELCMEVRSACEPYFDQLYHNLTWPNKLQCHRYPASDSPGVHRCVMPNEGLTFNTRE